MSMKNYFEPEMEVLELELQGFLCGSDGSVEEDGESNKDTGEGGTDDF